MECGYGVAGNNASKSIRQQASQFVLAKRFDEAIKLLTNSLKYNETSDICNDLAKVYLQTKQYNLAHDAILKCLKIKSSSVDAHINLGYYYQAINQSLAAKDAFLDALIHKALQDDVFGSDVCELLISFKNYKLCERIAGRKSQQFKHNLSQFTISPNYGTLTDNVQIVTRNTYETYLSQFSKYFNTTIEITMDINTTIIQSYYSLLGFCELKLRNFEKSLMMYQYLSVLIEFQQWKHASDHVRSVHQVSEKIEYNKFLSLVRNQIECEYYIALCYFHLEKYDNSDKIIKSIGQKLHSPSRIIADAYSNMSSDIKNGMWQLTEALYRVNQVGILAQSGVLNTVHVDTSQNTTTIDHNRNILDIISHLTRALQLIPDFKAAYSVLNEICTKIKYMNPPITYLLRAIELNVLDALALRFMGSARAQIGNLNEAIYYYNEYLKIRPDSMSTLHEMSQILMKQGNINTAMDCFGKCVHVALNKLVAELNLGIISDKPMQIYHILKQIKPHVNEKGLQWIEKCERMVNGYILKQQQIQQSKNKS